MAGSALGNAVSVYTTGYGVGPNVGINREDLLDLITNIDPWDNIIFAMLPKRRARSTTHEWPTDTLPTVSRAGVVDAAEYGGDTVTSPVRRMNWTQIFRWDVAVSGTQAEMEPAGINDTLAYQVLSGTHAMAKAAEQRFFDIGTGTVSGTESGTFGAGSTVDCPGYGGVAQNSSPRRMRPLVSLLDTSGTSPIIDMALATLTAVKVDDACEIGYSLGCKPDTLVLSPGVKRDLSIDLQVTTGSGAGTINVRNIAAAEKRVIRGVDVYEGELCTLSVIPNRSVPQASGSNDYGYAWLLEKAKLGIAFLRPIKAVDLAKTGDSEKKMLIGEFTLELLHPKGALAVKRVIT